MMEMTRSLRRSGPRNNAQGKQIRRQVCLRITKERIKLTKGSFQANVHTNQSMRGHKNKKRDAHRHFQWKQVWGRRLVEVNAETDFRAKNRPTSVRVSRATWPKDHREARTPPTWRRLGHLKICGETFRRPCAQEAFVQKISRTSPWPPPASSGVLGACPSLPRLRATRGREGRRDGRLQGDARPGRRNLTPPTAAFVQAEYMTKANSPRREIAARRLKKSRCRAPP